MGESTGLQIVSIDTIENNNTFKLHQDNLKQVADQVPAEREIVVISVVGAFRSGKSFFLSLVLRYLTYISRNGTLVEPCQGWYDDVNGLQDDVFDWKGGSESVTQGLRMWSKPFFIHGKAILLIDTQGLFDNVTTMDSISNLFALTTMISSYQIYNVEKRIQEDNLQFLAMFLDLANGYKNSIVGTERQEDAPFQHMSFLVRDWPNFRAEISDETKDKQMTDYLTGVFEGKEHQELNVTRAQIRQCFQKVSCYGLCHPGLKVANIDYNGDLKDVDEMFLRLFTRYMHHHVLTDAPSKVVLGSILRSNDLVNYFKSYTNMFADRADLPKAQTILEAMASVHNMNSSQLAIKKYKSGMSSILGCNYLDPDKLTSEHYRLKSISETLLHSSLKFVSQNIFNEMNALFASKIEQELQDYVALNNALRPSDMSCHLAIEKYKSGMNKIIGTKYLNPDKLTSEHYRLKSENSYWLFSSLKFSSKEFIFEMTEEFNSSVDIEFLQYTSQNNGRKPGDCVIL